MAAIRKRVWITSKGETKTAWLVDYRDQAGKRRAKQFERKKDAEAWLVTAAWEVQQGTHSVDSESCTVEQASALWIAKAEADGLERSTVKQYGEHARLHINPLIGQKKLSRLTMPAVENFRDALVATRSKAMAGKVVRSLTMILSEAMRRGLVSQNVAKGVKVVRKGRDKPRVVMPSRAELKALLDAANDDERPIVMTIILTGLRSSEIRGLRWQDIDLVKKTIAVSQRADQWNNIGPPKSDAGFRTIPIADALVKELKRWKLRAVPSTMDLAFPSANGAPQWHNNLVRRMFIPLQTRAGLASHYGLHSLRHAAASGWIAQKIDLKRLQVWIGHENIELTLQTYGHLIDDDRGDADIVRNAVADLF